MNTSEVLGLGIVVLAIGTLIDVVQMLATLDDPSIIGAAMAFALLTVLYAVFGAECILRPALRHIENVA